MAAIVISTTTERTAAAIMVPLSVVCELVTSGGKQSGLHRSGSSVVRLVHVQFYPTLPGLTQAVFHCS